MILQFEISPPFQPKLKIEKYQAMIRIYWLWFSIAYFPYFDINTLAKAFINIGKERMRDEIIKRL